MLPIIDQIKMEIQKIIDPEIYDRWMQMPNIELGMKSPIEVLSSKNYLVLWEFINKHKNQFAS